MREKMDDELDKQKKSMEEAIQNLKRLNLEFGKHLEESIIFDEINNTFSYQPEKPYEALDD